MRPRLFLHVMSVEARTSMSYRVDFWVNAVIGFAAQFALMAFLWKAMFVESGADRIGGYDYDGMLFYYMAVILFGKIVRGPELQGSVSTDIYEGGLNRYLVFPTNYLAFKYAQSLGSLLPAVLQLGLFAGVFLLVLDVPADASITPLSVAMGLLSLGMAHALYYVMAFPLQTVAFWADNVWSLSVALRFVASLLGGNLLPLTVFPAGAQTALAWLPFRYLYDVPVNVTLGRVGVEAWLAGSVACLAWILVFGLVARAVWRRGDLTYSGIGI